MWKNTYAQSHTCSHYSIFVRTFRGTLRYPAPYPNLNHPS